MMTQLRKSGMRPLKHRNEFGVPRTNYLFSTEPLGFVHLLTHMVWAEKGPAGALLV